MKKITLLIASLFITMGAIAQTPVLELTSDQIGASYPYQLADEDAEKVFALTDLTIAVRVNTPESLTGRKSLFATSDPTVAANSDAEGKNSRYVGYGLYGDKLAYLASWIDGDRFSTKAGISGNTNDIVIVYVINPTANTYKMYYNGIIPESGSYINKHADGFMQGYEIATPKMVKEDHENAKIYIGGAKNSSGNGEVFNGTITGVKVYDGALTSEQIANITAYSFDEVKLSDKKVSTTFGTYSGNINDIIDGNTENKWWSDESQAVDKTITLTLDTTTPVGVIKWYFCDNDKPHGATIERKATTDGEWIKVVDFTSDDIENNVFSCTAEGNDVKELRMRITAEHTNWIQVAEVELYRYVKEIGKTELQELVTEAEDLLTQITAVGKVKSNNEIDLTGKISSNAAQNAADGNNGGKDDGAGIAGLTDNDPATYFHSRWGGEAINEDHYLQIDLGEGNTLNDFVFEYAVRKFGNSNETSPAPTSIEVRVSEDGNDFGEPIVTLTKDGDNLPAHTDLGNTLWDSDVISTNKNARYIRLTVTGSQGPGANQWSGHYFFGMGTLNLYPTEQGLVVKEECKKYITAEQRLMFNNTLNKAKSINNSNAVLSSEVAIAINELSEQINAIKETIGYTLNITDAGYATLYLGFDAAIPELQGENAGVYIATGSSVPGYISLEKLSGVIPANTGVIVKANRGTYDFVYSAETKADVSYNLLEGSIADEYVAGTAYVLANGEVGIGLYKAELNKDENGNEGTTHFKNNANKAYLPELYGSASSASLRFDFGGATAIEEITEQRAESKVIFDLTGRRVNDITKAGVYIVNGKKVLVK